MQRLAGSRSVSCGTILGVCVSVLSPTEFRCQTIRLMRQVLSGDVRSSLAFRVWWTAAIQIDRASLCDRVARMLAAQSGGPSSASAEAVEVERDPTADRSAGGGF